MFLGRFLLALALLIPAAASAQTNPGFTDGAPLCANVPNPNCPGQTTGLNSAFAAKVDWPGGGTSPSLSFDTAWGATRGSILERGASLWGIVTPGAAGLPWVSNGAGADPAYQVLTGTALSVPFTESLTVSSNLATVAGFGFNPIAIGLRTTDSASCTCPTPGQNIPTLLTVEETFGGSSINNGRNGLAINLQMTSPTSATNPFRFYEALNVLANMQNGDGGTAGTPLGEIEGVTSAVFLQGTSTNVKAMIGSEYSLSANSGSSVAQKAVLLLDTFSTDAVHGVTNGATTGVDTFIWSFSQGVSFNTWAQIDLTGGVAPIAATGTFIKLIGSYTITNGFDFGNLTISGNALQWANAAWSLAGNGNATLNAITSGKNGGTGGSLTLNGATSGSGTINVTATGGTTQISSGQTSGFNESFKVFDTIAGNTVDSIVVNTSSANNSEGSITVATSVASTVAFLRVNNGAGTPLAKLGWGTAVTGGLEFLSGVSVAGTVINGWQIGAAPTGGDKGAGTINAATNTGTYQANGVTVADNAAWSASGFTPSPSCGTGTFTLNSSRFKTFGKATSIQYETTLNATGTCNTLNAMTFTLPATAQSSGVLPFYNAQSALAGMCYLNAASATATCVQSGGSNYAAAAHWLIAGVYENQ